MNIKNRMKRYAFRVLPLGLLVTSVAGVRAEGEFDASTVLGGIGTSLGPIGTAGLVLLGLALAIMIGIKFAKKVGNRAT